MKLKWNTYGRKEICKEEKKLRKMVLKLNRYAERHGIEYADLYLLGDESSRSVNIRAKKNGVEVVNSYAFVWIKDR